MAPRGRYHPVGAGSDLSTCFSPGIAIFCMLLTYYMWIKAVKTGSIYWAAMCALAYFYMVSVPVPWCPPRLRGRLLHAGWSGRVFSPRRSPHGAVTSF